VLSIAAVLLVSGFIYQRQTAYSETDRIPDTNIAPLSVGVTAAVKRNIAKSLTISGILVAREEVMVGSQVDGVRLLSYSADVGDTVKEGDVLARLDRDMLETRLLQNSGQIARSTASQATISAAIAEAEAADMQAKNAYQQALLSSSKYDADADVFRARETAYRATSALLSAQQQNLRRADAEKAVLLAERQELERGFGRMDIRAPASGVVSRRGGKVGQMVTTNATPLFQIIRDGEIELEAEITEKALAEIAIGQKVSVVADGVKGSIEGSVRFIAPTVDRQTHIGKIRVALTSNPALRSGLYAEAAIETASRNGIVVPRSAVSFTNNGPEVQIVRDGVVKTQKVTIGISDTRSTEIVDGLASGSDVVTRADIFPRDGDRMIVVRENTDQAPASQAQYAYPGVPHRNIS